MDSEQAKQFKREVISKQQALVNKSEWICCLNCYYLKMHGQAEHCALYDTLPPVQVLTVGCESWTERAPF